MSTAIEIKGLEKHYKGFDLKLDLELPSGCILGLVGENGAGKTTVIKSILSLVRPDAGHISVMGREQDGRFAEVLEQVGVVMSEPGFPGSMDARQAGKVMAGIYGSWDAVEYSALLERLDVPRDKAFKDLSRGNRMKLAICTALAHHPKLLILDEPTSGLDPVVRNDVVDLLLDFTRDEEHSVLISSHIVSDLEKLCDYIAFLHRGRLMLFEEKDRLLEEYCLVQCAPGDLAGIDPAAVKGRRETAYGVSALALRAAVPEGLHVSPVNIEELFILMSGRKGDADQ